LSDRPKPIRYATDLPGPAGGIPAIGATTLFGISMPLVPRAEAIPQCRSAFPRASDSSNVRKAGFRLWAIPEVLGLDVATTRSASGGLTFSVGERALF
jgi:hypothetical protein